MSENEDYDVLDLLRDLSMTDRAFYQTVRYLDAGTRNHVMAAHYRNQNLALGILRLYMTQEQVTVMNIPINMDMSGNFMDPVVVTATPEQIRAAVDSHVHTTDTLCSICQESVSCSTRIRHCGHCFHSTCIGPWFQMNPRCPMCRYDIRDYNPLRTTADTTTNDSSMHSDEQS